MKYTIEEIRNNILHIIINHKIPQVYLFGSYAKGTTTENSDIDLAIDSSNLHGLFALLSFEEEVSIALGKKVNVLTLRAIDGERNTPLKRDFLNQFNKEKICLYEQRY